MTPFSLPSSSALQHCARRVCASHLAHALSSEMLQSFPLGSACRVLTLSVAWYISVSFAVMLVLCARLHFPAVSVLGCTLRGGDVKRHDQTYCGCGWPGHIFATPKQTTHPRGQWSALRTLTGWRTAHMVRTVFVTERSAMIEVRHLPRLPRGSWQGDVAGPSLQCSCTRWK